MVAVARNICTAKNTPRARKISIIYYLLSIIYYLKSPVVQVVFVRPLRLGLLLSCVTKVTKRTFSVRRTWSPKSDFAGEKSDFVSGAATHKMVLSPVFRNTNPLQC